MLTGDAYIAELKIIDKPFATARIELPIIRSSVKDVIHSAISSPESNNRIKSLNNASVPNTGYRPLYTMMSLFAALGIIID